MNRNEVLALGDWLWKQNSSYAASIAYILAGYLDDWTKGETFQAINILFLFFPMEWKFLQSKNPDMNYLYICLLNEMRFEKGVDKRLYIPKRPERSVEEE